MIVLKVLEEVPELEAINDVKLNQRIDRQVMEAHQWQVDLDREEFQKNPNYTILLDPKKTKI